MSSVPRATSLKVAATPPDAEGTIVRITPASAGWTYVGFEVLVLPPNRIAHRQTDGHELCIVVVAGTITVESPYGAWPGLGGRGDPWSGAPDGAYLPPGSAYTIHSGSDGAEVALCSAPAPRGDIAARVLPGAEIVPEVRGYGTLERTIHPILMDDREAESLLVCEVFTPAGHWSSYPPHKHDRDALPDESLLEETYYHRVSPSHGFGLQRVYTEDRSLDVSVAVADRDCVLVPRGYHTVSAPPGYELYYLNVMAGPARRWAIANDPDHAWLLDARPCPGSEA